MFATDECQQIGRWFSKPTGIGASRFRRGLVFSVAILLAVGGSVQGVRAANGNSEPASANDSTVLGATTPTPPPNASPSGTPHVTPSPHPSGTPCFSATPHGSGTPWPTPSPHGSGTPWPTPSPHATHTPWPTPSPHGSGTPCFTASPHASGTPGSL